MSAPNRAKRRQSHEQGNHKPGVSHHHRGFEEEIGGDMEEIISRWIWDRAHKIGHVNLDANI